jgi:hypothetical protein
MSAFRVMGDKPIVSQILLYQYRTKILIRQLGFGLKIAQGEVEEKAEGAGQKDKK